MGASTSFEDLQAEKTESGERTSFWPLYVLFLFSGFPALLYQIVWERALFTVYGVNVESVTVIVTVFMLGLGIGSLAGGKLSAIPRIKALRVFGLIEFSIAIVGACSLTVLEAVARFTAGKSTAITGAASFALLLIPTMLMGSTLPLLVSHLVRRNGNVGRSVGSLYAVNTFGSGVACLCAANFLMRSLGESGVVYFAVSMNLLVGLAAIIRSFRSTAAHASIQGDERDPDRESKRRTVPLILGALLAAASGFIALGYEIVWYRAYAFASGGAAPTFAKLLGFYLIGIAYGSVAVYDACRTRLRENLDRTLRVTSMIFGLGAMAAFVVIPATGWLVSSAHIPLDLTYPLISISAALLGAVFPLVSHAAIDPGNDAGKRISYLYLSNIIGSSLGSFLIGFVIMNYLSIRSTTVLLVVFGFLLSIAVAASVRPVNRAFLLASSGACVLFAALSGPSFAHIYERLFLKSEYRIGYQFKNLVENRSGVIAVDSDERVFGGGIYDGQFNVDPINGSNAIFRAYAIPALHPHPRQVLTIGLASGSWAQVLVNYPEVQEMTIVEINPGYLQLIRHRPAVASLLDNPRVHIEIDDGRRWLIAHPGRKFDFILMNTTFNWRANASNLLSLEFMQLVRLHLNPGGVAYYNTTSSGEVQLTGASAFRHALRVSNFLAVSDSPLSFDRERCRVALANYTIDGHRMFDLSRQRDRAEIDHIAYLPFHNIEQVGQKVDESLEDRSNLLIRLQGKRLITDDNMGTEWPSR